MKSLKRSVILGAISMAMAMPAVAEKWDMPMAYSGSNFHSVTGAEFAKCVTTGTGGDIEIVTHPSGSLFPGAQIKRAIQSGQVPIGERLLSGHQNENALFGYDSVPFWPHHLMMRTSYGQPPSQVLRRFWQTRT